MAGAGSFHWMETSSCTQDTGERQSHFSSATNLHSFVSVSRASIMEAQRDALPCPPAATQPRVCLLALLHRKRSLLSGP